MIKIVNLLKKWGIPRNDSKGILVLQQVRQVKELSKVSQLQGVIKNN